MTIDWAFKKEKRKFCFQIDEVGGESTAILEGTVYDSWSGVI